MALCAKLSVEAVVHFLALVLEPRTMLKLAGRLGTVPRGVRLDKLGQWDLAWSLGDYYHQDVEVAKAVDHALRKDLGEPRLAPLVTAREGIGALEWLIRDSVDPMLDLSWALLQRGGDEAGEAAQRTLELVIADLDAREASERQAEEEPEGPAAPAAQGATPAAVPVDKELARQARRAQVERDRARKRSESFKERLRTVEGALAETRHKLKAAEALRERAGAEAERARAEVSELHRRLERGTAGEVEARRSELEQAQRRIRGLEGELEASRLRESELLARARSAAESVRTARPPGEDEEEAAALARDLSSWHTPVFTSEFYDSIRRWDRKIVRIAFEKIARLAEDWRHPSLRAIPLEGLPDAWRIRIASDVRLIYRPLDGGRVEILSLIDREDLQRYIRQAKSRPS